MKFSMIVLIVLLALVAAFGLQNPGEHTVRFLQLSWVTSMLGVIVASFAAGVLGGWLAGLPGFFRRRAEACRGREADPGARGRGRRSQENRRNIDPSVHGERAVSDARLSDGERKLLLCLLAFYREIGPGATPALNGLDEEAGLERWEISEAVAALRAKGLIEYWELQPAVRLTPEGLRVVLRLPEEGDA